MKKTVAIIGGGPAALTAAAFLNPEQFKVSIYERNKAIGRKFLVAGKGGFNLTHSEEIAALISNYSENPTLISAIRAFDNTALRSWLNEIGVPTYIGSSKRVYPEEGIKPIEVLNCLLNVLKSNNVQIHYSKHWKGWNARNELIFESGETINPDFTIFSLGGSSWKVTGSDGSWLDTFSAKGITTVPFLPANCAYRVDWSQEFLRKAEGQPLKNIALLSGKKRCKGEMVVTQFGLEGNAIYALSGEIQSQLSEFGKATIFLDLKPTLNGEVVYRKLIQSSVKITDSLRNTLKLSKTQIQLLKSLLTKDEFLDKDVLAKRIKSLPLTLLDSAPIDEAISTTGGISFDALSKNFELLNLEKNYCVGEMIDWNAPTGGYLLQACFSTGYATAQHLNGRPK